MNVRNLALLLLFGALVQTPGVAQNSRQKIEVSKLGPQVGERVPGFSLKDQNGNVQTLQSIMGPKGAMLVFVRSADWCPYCKTQLVELQSNIEELRKQGLGLATISYDPVEILAGFAKQQSITYTMLADVGSVTIKRFGILNPVPEWAQDPASKDDPEVQAAIQKYVSVVRPTAAMVGIAFPGTFILDREGRVKQRFFEDFYIERNTVSNLLVKLGDKTGAAVAGMKNPRRISTSPVTRAAQVSRPETASPSSSISSPTRRSTCTHQEPKATAPLE